MAKITIKGYVGNAPKFYDGYRRAGGDKASFAVARIAETPRRLNKDSGEWESGETLWLDAKVFGKTAENFNQNINKGDLVLITGTLSADSYTNKDGEKVVKPVITVDDFALVTKVKKSAETVPTGDPAGDPWEVSADELANPGAPF